MRRVELVVAALASACVLGAQVLLPRVFSVLLWYHLAFFAVSLALLGYAAGGVIVRRAVRATGVPGGDLDLPLLAAGAALGLPLALVVVARLPLEPADVLATWSAPALLLAMGLLLAVPFALLGTLTCALLDRAGASVGRTYAASFLGGAAGAALTVAAMDHLEPPRVLALLACLPLLAAALLRGGRSLARHGAPTHVPVMQSAAAQDAVVHGAVKRNSAARNAAWVTAAAVVAVLLAAPGRALPIDSRKHYPHVPPERVLSEQWNAFSRVTLYENPGHQGLWALPPSYAGPLPDMIGAAIDAWAITSILKRAPGRDADPVLPYYPPTLCYEGAEPGFDVLVIGAGGGIDVQAALAAGARHVTAVEINPLIVDAVRGRFRDWCGGLYDDPRVEVVVGEGRAFLERDTRTWDRIVLSGVDTFAATQAGAFALSENYLYTVEAFRAFVRHLRPGGVLGMTRWWFEPPRQTLRLALTAAAVLREQGVAQPGLRMFIAQAELNSLFLLRNGDFSAEQAAQLRRACEQRGAVPRFARETPSHRVFVDALMAPDPAPFIAAYPYDVEPTTDDRPFFFEYSRLPTLFSAQGDWVRDRMGGQEVLVGCLAVLALLCVPLVLLARGRRAAGGARVAARSGAADAAQAAAGSAHAAPGTVLPFALLGFGYLFVELPLMQRLSLPLGHPVLAVAVVLVSLLLWSGLGSLLAARLPASRVAAALPAVLALTALAVGLLLVGAHEALVAALADAGQPARVAAVVGFLALPGLLLGMPFPLAVRALRAAAGGEQLVLSTAFLANGLASVLCGPLATLLAMECGFRVTLLCGAGCYAAAAVLWRRLPAVSSAA